MDFESDLNELITLEQASKILGRNKQYIYQLIRELRINSESIDKIMYVYESEILTVLNEKNHD